MFYVPKGGVVRASLNSQCLRALILAVVGQISVYAGQLNALDISWCRLGYEERMPFCSIVTGSDRILGLAMGVREESGWMRPCGEVIQ